MKRVIGITFIAVSMLSLIGCVKISENSQISDLQKQVADLQEQVSDLQAEVDSLKETGEKDDASDDKISEIDDYLVTVEINNDNFLDYFELVTEKAYNAFGEEENYIRCGVKSKAYEDGLILYDCDSITVEYEISDTSGHPHKIENSLMSLLSITDSYTSGGDFDAYTISFVRTTSGKATFVKKEYAASYEVESQADESTAKITLKNGEILARYWANPECLYY